jgi:hypothetical protein
LLLPACLAVLAAHSWLQARENAGAAMFMEVIFWKGANVADDLRNEYNWRVSPAGVVLHSGVLHLSDVSIAGQWACI